MRLDIILMSISCSSICNPSCFSFLNFFFFGFCSLHNAILEIMKSIFFLLIVLHWTEFCVENQCLLSMYLHFDLLIHKECLISS